MRVTKKHAGKQIKAALNRASAEISGFAARGRVAGGLSGEGYAGGYRDALSDVLLVLNGIKPNARNYWDDWSEPQSHPEEKR